MIKRSTLVATAFVVTAAAFGLVAAPGCGSDKAAETVTDTGTSGGAGRTPPARPAGEKSGKTQWFALNALKLGLTTKDGRVDASAWKDYGYDLDGRSTTAEMSKTSQNSCKRRPGSQTKVLADGNEGIDNNFGQHVMAVIKSLKSDAEESVTQAVKDGSFTLLLKIDNLTTEDNAKAPGFVYVANDFNKGTSAPTFSETETGWQIVDGSLVDGKTIGNPKLQFPSAYVANGYWVSGDFGKGRIELAISLSGADIKLPIDSGIISFKVTDGSDGTIAGAMNTDALKEALTPVAKRFGICPGNATYDQVVETLTQSADLVSDAPNLQNTAVECNAISIALGFTAKKAGDHSTAPIKVTEPSTGPDECVEGGEAGTGG
ncbi:MAG: hypothetical protein HYV09_28020 [Deltaproteobacteria bacterium]|nr:hypothetical protein [Deltaproteobacteria bacterium]